MLELSNNCGLLGAKKAGSGSTINNTGMPVFILDGSVRTKVGSWVGPMNRNGIPIS
jgi:hypothetical protein